MNISEKMYILNSLLNSFVLHIDVLEKDIALDPDADAQGKPPRAEVLAGFREKKAIIENMIATLTEENDL